MAGICKYCGFAGTQDEMVEHAGSCPVMLEDFQPEILIQNTSYTEPMEICPKCAKEGLLINRPSGSGFCLFCDYQKIGNN